VDEVEISPLVPAEWLAKMGQKYNITKLAIDNYRYTMLTRALKEVGFDTDKKGSNNIKLIRPSNQMMIAPVINSLLINHELAWGDNPLLRWALNNTMMSTSAAGNITYGKIEGKSRKTDPWMACVCALAISIDLEDDEDYVDLNLDCYSY